MLDRDQRRDCRRKGEAFAAELLARERVEAGTEAMESFADGMIDSIGRLLGAHVSPDFAYRTLQDAADRLGRLVAKREG